MTRSTPAELIRALRSATAAERSQIMAAIGQQPAGPVHTAATVAANVATLRAVLEPLNEQQAVALLAESASVIGGVVEADLVALLTPFLDAHWEALEGDLGRVALLCGAYGRRVLGAAERRVRDARLKRGAVEIAHVEVLLEAAKAHAKEAGGEAGSEGAVDATTARLYGQLLADYAGELSGTGLVFGGFTAGDIALLRACKEFVGRHRPGMLQGDRLVLNKHLAALFTRAKKTGMDPETQLHESQIRAERAQYPNVLFTGLRKGEPAKWGGRVRDVDGRPDNGSGLWGGERDFVEIERALRAWMVERAKEKGMELGVQHVGHLLP